MRYFELVDELYIPMDRWFLKSFQTLTSQQKQAANILINGTNIEIFVRGEGSAAKLIKASSGTLFNDKQSIFGYIKGVDIIVPAGVQGNSSSATNAQQKTSVTNTKPESQQTNPSKTQVTKE